mgnify:CR=1 FL=1
MFRGQANELLFYCHPPHHMRASLPIFYTIWRKSSKRKKKGKARTIVVSVVPRPSNHLGVRGPLVSPLSCFSFFLFRILWKVGRTRQKCKRVVRRFGRAKPKCRAIQKGLMKKASDSKMKTSSGYIGPSSFTWEGSLVEERK